MCIVVFSYHFPFIVALFQLFSSPLLFQVSKFKIALNFSSASV